MATMRAPTEALGCVRCPLWEGRNKVVWGTGKAPAKIMLVGEAPGYYEDQSGSPFVGRAGKHLDKLLDQAGLTRDDVYISNRVKCRPPNNRDPYPTERKECEPWLLLEIEAVRPQVIVFLGRSAASLGFPGALMKDIRGTLRSMSFGDQTVTCLATYHPAAALRQGEVIDRLIVEDLKRAKGLTA